MNFKTINRPYLIQRGFFRDIKDEAIVGLDFLIDYDYMGASEFEWGALPQSLKRMTHDWKNYGIFPVEIRDSDGQQLQILCRTNQIEDVTAAVRVFAAEKYSPSLRTKEYVGLHDYMNPERESSLRTNFWWDVTCEDHIGNDWMACFGDNIRRLILAINKVCIKHGVSPEGPALPKPGTRPVKEMEISDDINAIRVLKGDKKTVIMKRNILEVQDTPEVLRIKVRTKAGPEKCIEIREKPCSARTLLVNMVKEWPERNMRK
jgi:hypothetical protein